MIKRRSWLGMIALAVVTLGCYLVYWFYDTARELIEANGESSSAALWTVLLIVPFGALFSYWFYASSFERFTHKKVDRILIYILLLFVPVAGWLVVQLELNEAALRGRPAALPA